MDIQGQLIHEIKNILDLHFPKDTYKFKDEFEQILGGADTEIYSFIVNLPKENISLELILRIYRQGATIISSQSEFETLNLLFNAGISVPKPYGYADENNLLKRPFVIMELIDGGLLADIFFSGDGDQEALLILFVENLVSIHSLNWEHLTSIRAPPNIKSDPYAVIKTYMGHSRTLIEKFKITELEPLIAWLQKEFEKYPCNELVLIHGDYHAMNVMIRDSGELVTIDWIDVKFGDRRQDIAFAIIAMDSGTEISLKQKFIDIYENLTNTKIEGIEFFMVLSVLHNFIRVYSLLFDYNITKETDTTRSVMIGEYSSFVKYFVNVIKDVTGLSFPKIEHELGM